MLCRYLITLIWTNSREPWTIIQ